MTEVIDARDISIRFGGLQALEGIDIDVGEWEIVGLIGPNGAGKTTFFNCLTGIYKPDRGTVRFRGRNISRLPTHRRAELGIARTWQNLGVVPTLSVLENVMTAQHTHIRYGPLQGLIGTPPSFFEEGALRHDAEEILEFLGLLPVRHELVSPHDRVLVPEAGSAGRDTASVEDELVVEPHRQPVTAERLERQRLDAAVAKRLVAAGEGAQVLDARDLEPDEVGRVVRDPLRVGVGEADAHRHREGEALHRPGSIST